MSFFSHVRPRRTAAMVKKLVRDLESGLYATPKSFDALARSAMVAACMHGQQGINLQAWAGSAALHAAQ